MKKKREVSLVSLKAIYNVLSYAAKTLCNGKPQINRKTINSDQFCGIYIYQYFQTLSGLSVKICIT